jgi:hypothetical protein
MNGPIHVTGKRAHTLEEEFPGIYRIDLRKGEEAVLTNRSVTAP